MAEVILTVQHEAGLHARPLAQFVKTAKQFDAKIQVTSLTRGKGPVNGASPLHLLLLAVLRGHEIKIEAEGPQAEEALTALQALVESDFAEGH
ncbi:MAG: HPr family phosphocarrier protein [Anaerolineales bacterium]|nr:HPr family phosphocarrier protein [Anaerolineales bacterium]MCB9431975.1 HPr family phosphocarrier protein [Ardenticatenaceae bacterium]